MTDRDTSFVSFNRSYRPWGQVRRQNLMTRILHILSLTVLGLAVIGALVVLAIFTTTIMVVGAAVLALFTLGAFIARKPARIFVRTRDHDNGKGIYEARKKGSTWSVY